MEFLLAFSLACLAQKPEGKVEPPAPVELARASPSELAVEAGRRALDAKAIDEACSHALRALELEPRSEKALALLLDLARDDADARALWSHESAAALCDERGKLALARELASAPRLRGYGVRSHHRADDSLRRDGFVQGHNQPHLQLDER